MNTCRLQLILRCPEAGRACAVALSFAELRCNQFPSNNGQTSSVQLEIVHGAVTNQCIGRLSAFKRQTITHILKIGRHLQY